MVAACGHLNPNKKNFVLIDATQDPFARICSLQRRGEGIKRGQSSMLILGTIWFVLPPFFFRLPRQSPHSKEFR